MNNVLNVIIPDTLNPVLSAISDCTKDLQPVWLMGGSTGLMLQGVPLKSAPRDLDLYADKDDALVMHQALKKYATDEQIVSETEIYRSILSHYEIEGVKVELVGAFEVHAMNSDYRVEIREFACLHGHRIVLSDSDYSIGLMPLMHELVFNVLRGRADRYEAIAKVCGNRLHEGHWRVLQQMIERNRFSESLIKELCRLLGQQL